MFGAAEPDERAPETRESALDAYTAEVGKERRAGRRRARRERARAATRAEIDSIKASARGEARARPLRRARGCAFASARARGGGGGDSAVHGPSRARVARRRRRRATTTSSSSTTTKRRRTNAICPLFFRCLNAAGRRPTATPASRRAHIRGAEGARPRGTRDADVSPRAARPSAAPATRGGVRRASTPRWAPSPGARRGSLRDFRREDVRGRVRGRASGGQPRAVRGRAARRRPEPLGTPSRGGASDRRGARRRGGGGAPGVRRRDVVAAAAARERRRGGRLRLGLGGGAQVAGGSEAVHSGRPVPATEVLPEAKRVAEPGVPRRGRFRAVRRPAGRLRSERESRGERGDADGGLGRVHGD